VRIYGISKDLPEQSRDFARTVAADGRGPLVFPLLFDPHSKTIDRYGLRDPAYAREKMNGVPHPAVFVLDQTGRVRWAKIESDYRVRPSNDEVAAALDAFEYVTPCRRPTRTRSNHEY
jgi:peroxiredoxin